MVLVKLAALVTIIRLHIQKHQQDGENMYIPTNAHLNPPNVQVVAANLRCK
jgi:hypothetical protein